MGFGDRSPKSQGARLFTCLYILVGLGLAANALVEVAGSAVRAAKRVGEPGTIVGLGKQRGIEMD